MKLVNSSLNIGLFSGLGTAVYRVNLLRLRQDSKNSAVRKNGKKCVTNFNERPEYEVKISSDIAASETV